MNSGFTLGGYVRIRTESGTVIFGPENRAAFLNDLHTYLYQKNPKVAVPVWQWHEAITSEGQAGLASVQGVGRSSTS